VQMRATSGASPAERCRKCQLFLVGSITFSAASPEGANTEENSAVFRFRHSAGGISFVVSQMAHL
jgi:hypothetical protein